MPRAIRPRPDVLIFILPLRYVLPSAREEWIVIGYSLEVQRWFEDYFAKSGEPS